jgi:hypothetical protein
VCSAKAGAASILRRDDHVAALDRFLDEGEEPVAPPASVHAAVNPDHRCVSTRAALLQRLIQRRGDFHAVDTALVFDVGVFEDASALRHRRTFGDKPIADLLFEIRRSMVFGPIANEELSSARSIGDYGWSASTAPTSTAYASGVLRMRGRQRRRKNDSPSECYAGELKWAADHEDGSGPREVSFQRAGRS